MKIARTLPVLFLAVGLCGAQPAFEVASVRPSAPGGGIMAIRVLPGGKLAATGAPLLQLIMKAYGVRTFRS